MFLPEMIERPKCRRCKGPLDFVPDDGHYSWHCNNLHNQHTPIMTDKEFKEKWNDLQGDDVFRLLKWITPKENESGNGTKDSGTSL